MHTCHSCGGNCASCSGCANSLTLTQSELDMLRTFSQIPFLPVARKADDMTPVYLETDNPDNSLILMCLEKKGLIDMDYHAPLRGFDYGAYAHLPLHGSMALTARGQSVLDTLDFLGAEQDV